MDSLGSLIKYIGDCDLQRVQKKKKLGGLSVTHSGAAMASTTASKTSAFIVALIWKRSHSFSLSNQSKLPELQDIGSEL